MKTWFIYIGMILLGIPAMSQTVTTAVPFLEINPGVRSAAMGNTGVAARPGVWAAFTNAASLAFTDKKAGAAFSYTPWMKNLVDGQNLYALTGFYKPGGHSALVLGARYFTLPEYLFMTEEGQELGTARPSDFAVDLAYSRRFGEHWAVALALRYIRSGVGDEVEGAGELEAAGAVAVDLSLYYTAALKLSGIRGEWRAGLKIANAGTRLSQYGADAYLPASVKLGLAANLQPAPSHGISLALECSRLMVEGNTALKDNSVPANIIGSFSNYALMKSIAWSVGAEYDYRHLLAGRIGYNHESEEYGNRTYFTLGLGLKYAGFSLDGAYLLPAADSEAPYKNTWQIGLGYVF